MKTSLARLMCMAFILVFSFGCGKDSSKGGNNNATYGYNPYTGTQLNGEQQTLMNQLGSWMTTADTNNLRSFAHFTTAIQSSTNNNTSCPGELKKILLFNVCIVKGTSSQPNIAQKLYRVGLPSYGDANYPLFCEVASNSNYCATGEIQYQGKANNTELVNALNGHGNTLILQSVTQSGSIYTIAYGTGLMTRPTHIYKIDTSVHSMYNPVEIIDLTASRQEWVQLFN